MLLKKGMPEEDEIVLCTVTNIHFHSVFAKLDAYDKTGMLHISEISPGRIRNIRDYVKEGKKIICKVLRIDREKGHIDLSLRRVNETQRRNKVTEMKQEQLAESILEFVAKKQKKDANILYEKLATLLPDYDTLYGAFEAVTNDELDLAKLGLEAALAKDLTDVIKQRIKLPEVYIKGEFAIRTYESNGVDVIREAMKKALAVKGDFDLKYKGAGAYILLVRAPDYKEAEGVVEQIQTAVLDHLSGHGEATFARMK